MGYTYQTVFPRVILEAIHALDKRSGNETILTLHVTSNFKTKQTCLCNFFCHLVTKFVPEVLAL